VAIVREFMCPTHGIFESRSPVCPHGCTDVHRHHSRPPACVSLRTRNIDRTLDQIAVDHHLTDISNKKGSLAASVDKYQPSAPAPQPSPVQRAIADRMLALGAKYGGGFSPGPHGSFWRDTSAANGQKPAVVTGSAEGLVPQGIKPRVIVERSHSDNGAIAQARVDYQRSQAK